MLVIDSDDDNGGQQIMAATFTEREPYERGFAEIFDRMIAPKFDDLEIERLELYRERRRRLIITIVGTTLVAVLLTIVVATLPSGSLKKIADFVVFIVVLPTLLAGYGGYHWIKKIQAGHRESLRGVIVEAVCEFFGDLEYVREPGDRFDHKRFISLGVIGRGSWARCEDLFIGRHRDTDFKMIDAHVQVRSNRSTHTVFDGLLFEIGVPANFSGRVIMGRDGGAVGNALKGFFKDKFGKEKRITFQHAAFEERYAVYASDPDEAYRLVTPGLCDTMVALADAHDEKSLGAAFVDGAFLLAVPVSGDLFEPGSIKLSVHDCEDDIHTFLEQLTTAHRVIGYLHGDHREAGEDGP